MTRPAVEFVRYLRETLIPDLRDSGREFSADDFEEACQIICNLNGVIRMMANPVNPVEKYMDGGTQTILNKSEARILRETVARHCEVR